ncbi:MAG: HD-GYP domain-containing protein [Candidatus Brocadia sp.]
MKDPSVKSMEDKDFSYLKESISSILEKTRKASIQSLCIMVRNIGAAKYLKHNHQVVQYIELIVERFSLPPGVIESFKNAALLHDNFKILLEKTLKSKRKGLNTREKIEIESHPDMMIELTKLFDFFANERSILQHHHKNYDGSGYPTGLTGNEIPLGARIFAMVVHWLPCYLSDLLGKAFRLKRLLKNSPIMPEVSLIPNWFLCFLILLRSKDCSQCLNQF